MATMLHILQPDWSLLLCTYHILLFYNFQYSVKYVAPIIIYAHANLENLVMFMISTEWFVFMFYLGNNNRFHWTLGNS